MKTRVPRLLVLTRARQQAHSKPRIITYVLLQCSDELIDGDLVAPQFIAQCGMHRGRRPKQLVRLIVTHAKTDLAQVRFEVTART